MPDIMIETEVIKISKRLKKASVDYLKISTRGNSISVFSEYEGKRENRCRFTQLLNSTYILSIANHNGKWESTPFEGSIDELFEIVITNFEWILCDYNQ